MKYAMQNNDNYFDASGFNVFDFLANTIVLPP